jgi:hypothetical protein
MGLITDHRLVTRHSPVRRSLVRRRITRHLSLSGFLVLTLLRFFLLPSDFGIPCRFNHLRFNIAALSRFNLL